MARSSGPGNRGRPGNRSSYGATAGSAGNLGVAHTLTLAPTLHNWLLFDPADQHGPFLPRMLDALEREKIPLDSK